jgi:hypothetical protein
MLAPPVLLGAAQVTVADPSEPTAVTPVGAPGTVAGITDADALEATLVPALLLALTVNV